MNLTNLPVYSNQNFKYNDGTDDYLTCITRSDFERYYGKINQEYSIYDQFQTTDPYNYPFKNLYILNKNGKMVFYSDVEPGSSGNMIVIGNLNNDGKMNFRTNYIHSGRRHNDTKTSLKDVNMFFVDPYLLNKPLLKPLGYLSKNQTETKSRIINPNSNKLLSGSIPKPNQHPSLIISPRTLLSLSKPILPSKRPTLIKPLLLGANLKPQKLSISTT